MKNFLFIILLINLFLISGCNINNETTKINANYTVTAEPINTYKIIEYNFNNNTRNYEIYIEFFKDYEYFQIEVIAKDNKNYIIESIIVKKENLKANNKYVYYFDFSHIPQGSINKVTINIEPNFKKLK